MPSRNTRPPDRPAVVDLPVQRLFHRLSERWIQLPIPAEIPWRTARVPEIILPAGRVNTNSRLGRSAVRR